MSATADGYVDEMERAGGLWPDDPTGPDEPPEFDCPECGGPAHCHDQCKKRMERLQEEVNAWHVVWKSVRRHLYAPLRTDGDALVEPF